MINRIILRISNENGDQCSRRCNCCYQFTIKDVVDATATEYSKEFGSGYRVYKIYDEGELIYIGMTKNPSDREKAHRRRFGDNIQIDYIVNDTSLSKARVIETGLITYHGLEKLKNDRLSISSLDMQQIHF